MTFPTEGLYRAGGGLTVVRAVPAAEPDPAEVAGNGDRMVGHFAVFDQWTEINSAYEGNFLERVAPGAFRKSFREQTPVVLFQHGRDLVAGDRPLGTVESLSEDDQGAAYEVRLFTDTSYVRDLMPGLEAGAYGASFRFNVQREDLVMEPKASDYNPKGLPERTIREARVSEFGPVTFPAYPGASAGLRSITDDVLRLDRERQARQDAPQPTERAPAREVVSITPRRQPTASAAARSTSTSTKEQHMNRQERVDRVAELRQWIDSTHAEYRDDSLPADLAEQWTRNNAELVEHERVLAELEQRDARVFELASAGTDAERGATFSGDNYARRTGGAPALISRMSEREVYDLGSVRVNPLNPASAAGELRERALRANELAHYPTAAERGQEAAAKAHVESLIRRSSSEDYNAGEVARRILATGSTEYRNGWRKLLAAAMSGIGGAATLTPAEARAVESVRALSVGTGANGGFAVPYQLDPTIIPTSNLSVNPFRALANVESIAGTNEWRGLTSAGVTAAYAAEATETSDNSPSFSQPTLTTVRAQCFVPVSIELTQDFSAIESGLGMLIQDAKDDLEATQFTTGTGTNAPQGIITGATTTVTTAALATFAIADLYALENALGPRFRPRAAIIGNRGTYNRTRQFDTAGGSGVWLGGDASNLGGLTVGLTNNVPRGGALSQNLLGYPTFEDSAMVATTTSGSKILVMGDFRYYKIIDRVGMDIEIIPHLFGATNRFPTGQRGFFAFWRNTARVLDPNAFRVLTVQ